MCCLDYWVCVTTWTRIASQSFLVAVICLSSNYAPIQGGGGERWGVYLRTFFFPLFSTLCLREYQSVLLSACLY